MGIEVGFHFQTALGSGRTDEIDYRFIAHERLASPSNTDLGKQSMFYLVPLACPWGKVTNRHCQAVAIGKLLDAVFPQSVPAPVATTAIGGNQKLGSIRIPTAPQHPPPTIDALHGELRGVVTDSHIHKALVLDLVEKAIGIGTPLGQV